MRGSGSAGEMFRRQQEQEFLTAAIGYSPRRDFFYQKSVRGYQKVGFSEKSRQVAKKSEMWVPGGKSHDRREISGGVH